MGSYFDGPRDFNLFIGYFSVLYHQSRFDTKSKINISPVLPAKFLSQFSGATLHLIISYHIFYVCVN